MSDNTERPKIGNVGQKLETGTFSTVLRRKSNHCNVTFDYMNDAMRRVCDVKK
jgi:hypothetical protein